MSLTKIFNNLSLSSLTSFGRSLFNKICDPNLYTKENILSTVLHSLVVPSLIFILCTVVRRKLSKPGKRDAKYFKQTYGGWALVTGASSGIGSDFAKILASEGFNVVLTARTESSLKAVSEEIENEYGVETRIVLADLSKKDGAREIHDEVSDLDIGILINNAGAGWFGRVRDEDVEHIENLIQLNCTSMAVLTQLFVNSMRKRNRPSGIIITSSLGSYGPMPNTATYTAAKAFASRFGGATSFEESNDTPGNVHITVLEPGATATKFAVVATSGTLNNRPGMATSAHVANQALNYLAAGKIYCIPDDRDYYFSVVLSFIPYSFVLKSTYNRFKSFGAKKD